MTYLATDQKVSSVFPNFRLTHLHLAFIVVKSRYTVSKQIIPKGRNIGYRGGGYLSVVGAEKSLFPPHI